MESILSTKCILYTMFNLTVPYPCETGKLTFKKVGGIILVATISRLTFYMMNEQDNYRQEISQNDNPTRINATTSSDNTDTFGTKENTVTGKDDEILSGGYGIEEVAENDGSIIETLDTAFHNEPGLIKDHSLAGSNRADYYESRSYGKTDSEEELEALKKQQSEKE